ncbi:MAG: hypothetical protein CL942_07395 [Desulfovibrio sp.]|nr:hypothetical protein [Desulfovibrio sp.]
MKWCHEKSAFVFTGNVFLPYHGKEDLRIIICNLIFDGVIDRAERIRNGQHVFGARKERDGSAIF